MDEEPVRKINRLRLREYLGCKAYLLTLVTANRAPLFSDDTVVAHCLNELKSVAESKRFDVPAYCFMPDHLHLLASAQEPDCNLIDFVKAFKQRTGFWFRRRFRGGLKASPTGLWQRSYHDHILRTAESFEWAAEYVLSNPVEEGLAEDIGVYPYAGSLTWPHLNPGTIQAVARLSPGGA